MRSHRSQGVAKQIMRLAELIISECTVWTTPRRSRIRTNSSGVNQLTIGQKTKLASSKLKTARDVRALWATMRGYWVRKVENWAILISKKWLLSTHKISLVTRVGREVALRHGIRSQSRSLDKCLSTSHSKEASQKFWIRQTLAN